MVYARTMRRRWGVGVVLAGLWAGCAVSEGVVRVDDPLDAGTLALDAGTPALDAGMPASDVGMLALDAGMPALEAGMPALDVGMPALDAGMPASDAGMPAQDVGCVLPPSRVRPPSQLPEQIGVVRAVATEHPDWLTHSCAERGGNLRFLFEVVRRLRAGDPRWGLDRRDGALRGDIVTYFHGDGCPEGSDQVYAVDVIARRCAVPGVDEPAAPSWLDVTGGGARWSLQGFDPAGPGDAGVALDAGSPTDTGTTTRLPLPDQRALVEALGRERADLLGRSCGNNDWLFEAVRRLRRTDRRWGLNWKRGVTGDLSQDVVDYYYGSGEPREGATEVYIVDVIVGHCGDDPRAGWLDQTEATRAAGTIGRWTLAGRSDLGP